MSHAEQFELVRASLNASVPFAAFVGVEIVAIDGDGATARLPDSPSLLNHIGSQHAGALYTVAEAASGAAMASAFADLLASVTRLVRQGTMRYMKVARGPITARATLVRPVAELREALSKDGKVDFIVAATLSDQGEVEVATFEAEWSLRFRQRS